MSKNFTELDHLIEQLRDNDLSEPEQARLIELLTADPDSQTRFAQQMALSAALRNRAVRGEGNSAVAGKLATSAARQQRTDRRYWLAMIAVCLLLALGIWSFWKPDPTRSAPPKLAAGWQITPTGNADYRVIEPTVVHLRRGELLVESVQEDVSNSLRIQTPHGQATATGTRFFIGSHSQKTQESPTESEGTMLNSLTRVLVLSGMVTLTTTMGSVEGTTGSLLAAEPDQAPTELAVEANSDFAFDLYLQLAKADAKNNLFFSPYSVSSALAMTAEGARGQTAEEMGAVLRFPNATRRIGADAQLIPWETAKIHTGMGEIYQRLNRDTTHYQLSVVNALWSEKTFPLSASFVKALTGPYGTSLMPADFIHNAESERQRINRWVEDNTEKRIKNLLQPGAVDASSRLVLTNAIYFKGDWSQPFSENATEPEIFMTDDGTQIRTLMMKHDPAGSRRKPGDKNVYPFGYAGIDAAGKPTNGGSPNLQILEMPYAGQALSMFVLLPARNDGLPELEKQLSQQRVNQWLNAVKKREVAVWMPKFKFESDYGLKSILMDMGMPSAFRPGGFTGISSSADSQELYIGAVKHKAFIEVSEHGTEAAAATAISGPTGLPRHPIFVANRPFVFLIRDNETGSILFFGRVMNPTVEK